MPFSLTKSMKLLSILSNTREGGHHVHYTRALLQAVLDSDLTMDVVTHAQDLKHDAGGMTTIPSQAAYFGRRPTLDCQSSVAKVGSYLGTSRATGWGSPAALMTQDQ